LLEIFLRFETATPRGDIVHRPSAHLWSMASTDLKELIGHRSSEVVPFQIFFS
jgi:hypothetical protein